MKKFRVFVEDRSPGLFSGLMDVKAENAAAAVREAKRKNPPNKQRWGIETYHALEWPVKTITSQHWLAVHVDGSERVA